VQRLYKRWTPAVGVDNYGQWPVADDGGQWPVASGQREKTREESLAADRRGSAQMISREEEEAEEWEEAGFEKPMWIDMERRPGEEETGDGRPETREEENRGKGEGEKARKGTRDLRLETGEEKKGRKGEGETNQNLPGRSTNSDTARDNHPGLRKEVSRSAGQGRMAPRGGR
jgi:hypothetical protein